MLRDIKGSQRLPRLLAARIAADGTLSEGGISDFTSSKEDTGHYRLTPATPFKRLPTVVATVDGTEAFAYVDNLYADYFDVKVSADGDTPADAKVNVLCLGWDTPDQY